MTKPDTTTDKTTDNLPATIDAGTALAPLDEWADLVNWDDGSSRFVEHFGLSVPRLRSDFGRNGAGWIDDLTGEEYRSLEIVILAMPPSRSWWATSIDEGGGGDRPDCSSLDMVMPLATSIDSQSDLCSTCPHSKWGDDGAHPACQEAVNVLAYDQNGNRFVWLRFRGTALRPFRDYVSALRSRRIYFFATGTTVELVDKEDGSKKWLVPKFGIGAPLSREQAEPLRRVAQEAMANWQQVAQEMAASEGGNGGGPFDGPAGGTAAGTSMTGATADDSSPF